MVYATCPTISQNNRMQVDHCPGNSDTLDIKHSNYRCKAKVCIYGYIKFLFNAIFSAKHFINLIKLVSSLQGVKHHF